MTENLSALLVYLPKPVITGLNYFLANGTMLAKSHLGQYLRNHTYVNDIKLGVNENYEII